MGTSNRMGSSTIMNGDANGTDGEPPGTAGRFRDLCIAPRVPNGLIRQARQARRSPSGSGRVWSRQEVAEAVNAFVFEQTGRRCCLDGRYIGQLERGEIRWPSTHYRAGLRAVLGAATDAEIGLFVIHGAGRPDQAPAEAGVPAAPSTELPGIGADDAPEAVTPVGVGGAPSLLRSLLVERHCQVYRTFRAQFLRAARELADREGDPMVGRLDVSERRFQRWIHGLALPRPEACRVLESMFGQPIDRLIGPADAGAAGAAVDVARHAAPPDEAGGGFPPGPQILAGQAAVLVHVSAGAAVTVLCHDSAAGRVAVLAGAVRVLIEASDAEPGGLAEGAVDTPMVTGASAAVEAEATRRVVGRGGSRLYCLPGGGTP